MFQNRKLVIATMHEKEKVIAPLMEKEFGISCFVSSNINTDSFGTFCGEMERLVDPLSTARAKCLQAMKETSCDMGIASEGSFGQHPTIFFVPADDEIVIFIDKKNGLEITARELSTETNFKGAMIHNEQQLEEFAESVGFPSHGIIARKNQIEFTGIQKGIISWEKLKDTCFDFIQNYGSVYLETDMRAMYNPTRMKVIERATKKLVDKINSCCFNCGTPGFDISEMKKGLPCSFCRFPTQSTMSWIYSCQKCEFRKEILYPTQKMEEEPMYCDVCNP
jgi:hypothetical protein